jgi:nascent polypeptide-associated complex subunit alpha
VVSQRRFPSRYSPLSDCAYYLLQVLFVIATPDVFKSSNSDTYIVFGEAKIEDPAAQQAQINAAQALAGGDSHSRHGHSHAGHVHGRGHNGTGADEHSDEHSDDDDDDDGVPDLEEAKATNRGVEEDEDVDETGVDSKDIELVMAQVKCRRAKAVRVLKENDGDLITASGYCDLFRLLLT